MKAMEMTWNNMEKKEKLMWIKKAAEDQKRYEVGGGGAWAAAMSINGCWVRRASFGLGPEPVSLTSGLS